MMNRNISSAIISGLLAAPVLAQTTLLTQERTITAGTTFNGQVDTVQATTFDPFIATAQAATTFPVAGGGTAPNAALTSINCIVDPNAIRAAGSLQGAGGITITGGQPSPVFGEAAALIRITFQVTNPIAYRITATPRPNSDPRDEFEIALKNITTNHGVFSIDQTSPPQHVQSIGLLNPGDYTFGYQCELSGIAALTVAPFEVNLRLGCLSLADVGKAGGLPGPDSQLDNNDFVAFIDLFFTNDDSADLGSQGGIRGHDGLFDNNDFVVFIDEFFAGC